MAYLHFLEFGCTCALSWYTVDELEALKIITLSEPEPEPS